MLQHLRDASWELVRCENCSQVFHKFILDEEWNERRFSDWMDAKSILEFEGMVGHDRLPHQRKFDAEVGYVEHILRLERLTHSIRTGPVRLLDFGCGWGGFLKAAKSFGFDAVGVDRSTARIEGAGVPVFPSLQAIEQREKFHAITLFEVLEHLDEPAAVLNELADHIVPGGVLVLETPNCAGVTDIRSINDYRLVHPLEHINAFTHETMISIARRAGFDVIVRGPVYVTAEYRRAAKRTARHLLGQDGRHTQLYFRRAA